MVWCYLLTFIISLLSPCLVSADFFIVQDSRPNFQICLPELSSEQERFASSEIVFFVKKLTGIQLQVKTDSDPQIEGDLILIGTEYDNRYINELYDRGFLSRRNMLAQEEFIVRSISTGTLKYIVIVGGSGRAVIYGAYELIEKMIASVTGFQLVDLDFDVKIIESLSIKDIDVRKKPFYPDRCALSREDPNWLSRHRINISGAEGVWSGTGIDDGIGTAFKYVYEPQFEDYQDEPYLARWNRAFNLKRRLRELEERGIEAYLFMYVVGEPTKALAMNHPELLEQPVRYRNSRNGDHYFPLSWTKQETRELIKELTKSIVRTYSPFLKGFHLRSWGWETRAPAGNDAQQQDLLWSIYFDIIESAKQIEPNFKFIISGYDSYWLKDPDRKYIARLPKGTIILMKWGVDGEPTNDPEISPKLISDVERNGCKLMILSHDVEEVMPLWMLEADLFVQGVRKYATNSEIKGLCGFTLQGTIGLSKIDKIISSRINFDPFEDHVTLMGNYLTNMYGMPWQHILNALRNNSSVLSDFFSDFGGLYSLTGKYGNGSRGYATRLWDIIGEKAVKDIVSMPDIKTVKYAKSRLSKLLPKQQISANELHVASKLVSPRSEEALQDLFDFTHMMNMWVAFFESRLKLLEAMEMIFNNEPKEEISSKIKSSVEYCKQIKMQVSEIRQFVNVFSYDNESARRSITESIQTEISFLESFDPRTKSTDQVDNEVKELGIVSILVHPNPVRQHLSFCYYLSSVADEVVIKVYSPAGRLIKTISGASSNKGYNEEYWDTRDEANHPIANGTYLYKISANKDGKKVHKIGKFSVLR